MQIKTYIEQSGISVADFAKMVGVRSRMTMYRYIKGERKPSMEVLSRIKQVTHGLVTEEDFATSEFLTSDSFVADYTKEVRKKSVQSDVLSSGNKHCASGRNKHLQGAQCNHAKVITSFEIKQSFKASTTRLFDNERLTKFANKLKASTMGFPPKKLQWTPVKLSRIAPLGPLEMALQELGGRVEEIRCIYHLDGRPSSPLKIVEAANRVRQNNGLPILSYPGINS